MFSRDWMTSQREYGVAVERNVQIEMSDGVLLDADIFRPKSAERFPAILGVHAYDNAMQSVHCMPVGMKASNSPAEAGDPYFYARRGYVHVLLNARGTGKSGGKFSNYAPREVEDYREAIAWIAKQDWCTGKVGMFGASYFSVAAKQVAATNPPELAAVWATYGYTDFYRDKFYHGGILNQAFLLNWAKGAIADGRIDSWSKHNLTPQEYEQGLVRLAQDPDIMAIPELAMAVRNPDAGAHPLIIDVLLNATDGPYWHERATDASKIKMPIVIGACWSMYGLHLPAEFRAWEVIDAPKKMFVGPPIYLDRPIYQYAYASLRFFDHWLKGVDTGFMDGKPIQVFLTGNGGRWIEADDWPLPETIWHPFYLHRDGLLSEHEFWPNEGATSFENNTFNARGSATFTSPPMVESTTILGPSKLTLYVSTSDTDVHLFVSLWDIAPDGTSLLLSRGWLKGSLRKVDETRSKPWMAVFPFDSVQPMTPDTPEKVEINIVEIGNVFQPGHRIAVKISATDEDPPRKYLDVVGQGHQLRRQPAWISIHHDDEHPSTLHLPVISGNLIGTFMSGGNLDRPAIGQSPGGGTWEAWNK